MARNNVNQLSKWVRPYMRSAITARAAVRDLVKPYFEYLRANPPHLAEGGQWKAPFQMPNTSWLAMPNGSNRNNRFGRSHSNRLARAQPSTFQSASSYQSANPNQRKNVLSSSMTQCVQSTNSMVSKVNGSTNGVHGNSVSPPNLRRDGPMSRSARTSAMTQIASSTTTSGGPNNLNHSNSSNRFFSQSDRVQNGGHENGQNPHYGSASNVSISPLNGNSRTINGLHGDDMKSTSISPAQQASMSMRNGNANGRKRKYVEFQNENVNPPDINVRSQWTQKRMKSDVLQNGNSNDSVRTTIEDIEDVHDSKPEPNCIQCKCGALICKGEITTVELQKGKGITQEFIATKQPFPVQTASNCIWSSQLGMTFMWHKCTNCNTNIGFHVVGASTQHRLQYVENILFMPTSVKLLQIPK